MRIALNKVRRDLWENKGRTVLVILSIAVGVFALGLTGSSNLLMAKQLKESHLASNPSTVLMWLGGVVQQDTIDSLSKMEGVTGIDGIANIDLKWKRSLDDTDWQDGSLVMINDYEDQGFDRFTLKNGVWPHDRAINVEDAHMSGFDAPGVGESIYFEVNDRPREFHIVGSLHDPYQFPPPFGENAYFYATRDTLRQITGVEGYTMLRMTITEYTEDRAYKMANKVEDRLEEQGISIGYVLPVAPEEHFLQEIMNGVGVILSVMAFASLGLSTILVINTMNALIAQQIPQIGIMKSIGAIRKQIVQLYLAMVITYGLVSLLIAVPLGAVSGIAMANWMLYILNTPPADFTIIPGVLIVQIFMGMLTPILAAAYPVLRGAAIQVARALTQTGLGSGTYGTRRIDRWMGRVRNIPRIAVLSLRNTFRRPGRVMMTLVTLTLAGAIYMMVISAQHSLNATIDQIFASFGFEVMIGFEQNQRIDEIIPMIESRPDVEFAEMWGFYSGDAWLEGENGEKGEVQEIYPRALPRDSQLFEPKLTEGRALHPDDGRAMLLNQKVARKMGVELGDRLVVEIGDNTESTWTVVGLVFDLGGDDQNTAFMYLDEVNAVTNNIGRGSVAEVRVVEETLEMQKKVETDLRDYLEANSIGVAFADTALEYKQQAASQFNVLVTMLMIMTLLMGAVGSMGLSGTLSINVIERRREIGVMRAVGASSKDVTMIFSGEGLMLGLISWIIATPLSLLIGPMFVKMVGNAIDFPAQYIPAIGGIWVWLIIVIVLSLIASWLPARRATRISVNESLAYE